MKMFWEKLFFDALLRLWLNAVFKFWLIIAFKLHAFSVMNVTEEAEHCPAENALIF